MVDPTGSGTAVAWPVTSATEAVAALVRLVTDLDLPGWAYVPAGGDPGTLDLRAGADIEPVPIVLPDGSTVGTIRCPARPTGDPADATLRLLTQTVVLLVAMERRGFQAVDRATTSEREARLDPLTGLPNRRLWDEAIAKEQARCSRHGLQALVAVVDLDSLKATNEAQGHLAGDVLLRVTAQSLRRAVRDTDLVARLGGDEFAVLAVEYEPDDPGRFGARLERALDDDHVAASVGVAVADPGTALEAAYDRADRAMFAVKHARKGGWKGG
jgi:diguanylate cyclase (GGDEF)-like protein